MTLRRLSVALALLAPAHSLTGCHVWRVDTAPPAQSVAATGERPIRVLLTDGRELLLAGVSMRGDTLFGSIPESGTPGTPPERVAIPRGEIRSVALQERSFGRTLGAIGGGAGMLAGALWLVGS